MDSIKVLILDENVLVRRAVSNILNKYDVFDVFWMADRSQDVTEVINQNYPDVVLLNIDNMESSGFTILNTLRMNFPNLPVIVISPRDNEGAEAAINALRMGAIDFISKPAHKNLILFAERHLEKRLGPIIKAAKKIRERHHLNEEILQTLVHPQKTFEQIGSDPKADTPAELVVIGGCTGGTQTLFSLISELPDNLEVPVVVVQHLPRIYTAYLAQKLDSVAHVNVREVQDGDSLEGGNVWIAPGGYQCEVGLSGYQKVLKTHRGMRENNMRPSIDILFRSAAKVYGKKTLGILLSGCGYDGLSGAEDIRNMGGQLIAQDPRTAIAAELPLAAIRNGLTREYYSPEDLAKQIVYRVARVNETSVEGETDRVGSSLLF